MMVAHEKILGPVLAVQRSSTEQEAMGLANGTKYGLLLASGRVTIPAVTA